MRRTWLTLASSVTLLSMIGGLVWASQLDGIEIKPGAGKVQVILDTDGEQTYKVEHANGTGYNLILPKAKLPAAFQGTGLPPIKSPETGVSAVVQETDQGLRIHLKNPAGDNIPYEVKFKSAALARPPLPQSPLALLKPEKQEVQDLFSQLKQGAVPAPPLSELKGPSSRLPATRTTHRVATRRPTRPQAMVSERPYVRRPVAAVAQKPPIPAAPPQRIAQHPMAPHVVAARPIHVPIAEARPVVRPQAEAPHKPQAIASAGKSAGYNMMARSAEEAPVRTETQPAQHGGIQQPPEAQEQPNQAVNEAPSETNQAPQGINEQAPSTETAQGPSEQANTEQGNNEIGPEGIMPDNTVEQPGKPGFAPAAPTEENRAKTPFPNRTAESGLSNALWRWLFVSAALVGGLILLAIGLAVLLKRRVRPAHTFMDEAETEDYFEEPPVLLEQPETYEDYLAGQPVAPSPRKKGQATVPFKQQLAAQTIAPLHPAEVVQQAPQQRPQPQQHPPQPQPPQGIAPQASPLQTIQQPPVAQPQPAPQRRPAQPPIERPATQRPQTTEQLLVRPAGNISDAVKSSLGSKPNPYMAPPFRIPKAPNSTGGPRQKRTPMPRPDQPPKTFSQFFQS